MYQEPAEPGRAVPDGHFAQAPGGFPAEIRRFSLRKMCDQIPDIFWGLPP